MNEFQEILKSSKGDYFPITLKNYMDAVDALEFLEKEVQKYLLMREYDVSVFYLGCISHFIADCACFTHVVDYVNDLGIMDRFLENDYQGKYEYYKGINKHYREMISERTNCINVVNSKYNYIPNYDFFILEGEIFEREVFELILNNQTLISPSVACERTAKNTCFDTIDWNQPFPYTSSYMLNNYNHIIRNKWESIPSDWKSILTDNSDLKNYLLKIENSLKFAIKNIAFVLDSIVESIYRKI